MSNRRFKKRSAKRCQTRNDTQTILMQASQAHSEGRLGDAEKGYLEVLRAKPAWGQVLNALGTVYLDLSEIEKAKSSFAKAIQLNPPDLSASYNLARILQRDNDHNRALQLYENILAQQPDNGLVWNNMGVAHRETGNQDLAISCFEKAVGFSPDMAEAWNNLAVAQDESGFSQEAITTYRKALEVDPDYTSAHFNLGSSLQKLKQFQEAEKQYQRVLAIEPGHEAAKFMLQSLGTTPETPVAAPVAHVRRIFDQCAGSFEKILVKDLDYKTPELLFTLVQPYLSTDMNILDLGCGTGLGAVLYRPYARHLTGVDVSAKMLEKAAEKNLYDQLEKFDILQDWAFPRQFNLIYSSDVFVYFGALERIIGSMALQLHRGGLAAFSVERLGEENLDYRLNTSGRYAHSERYIKRCLQQHRLQLLESTKADLRKESGSNVEGLLIVAGREN